jgi:hypothetical protein
MKDGIPVIGVFVVGVSYPIAGQEMQFDGPFEDLGADAYPGIPEIGPLILVPSAGKKYLERTPRFGTQVVMIEIAMLPDKV